MTTYTPKFSAPFLNMEQLCKETGIAYKSLEAFVSNRKKQGIDVVNIDATENDIICNKKPRGFIFAPCIKKCDGSVLIHHNYL